MMLMTLRLRQELFAALEPALLAGIHGRAMDAARVFDGTIPSGTFAAVKADIVYAVARHRHFRGAPLFHAVLAEHLVSDYRLDPRVAIALAEGAAHTDQDLPAHATSDLEFLRSIFVASASATDEASLIVDLGLGKALLTRIRQSVETAVQGGDGARYLPELDSQITEILCELARESKTVPWALHVHRLRYHLLDSGTELRDWIRDHGIKSLFDLLLSIGSRGAASRRHVQGKLRKLGVTPETSDEDPGRLLALLAAHGLVYSSGEDDDRRRWHLTPFATELTADAFARNLVNTVRAPLAELTGLPSLFQAAVIRAVPYERDALANVVRTVRPMSQQGLVAALERLLESDGDAAVSAVSELLQSESSTFLRKAAQAFAAKHFGPRLSGRQVARSADVSA